MFTYTRNHVDNNDENWTDACIEALLRGYNSVHPFRDVQPINGIFADWHGSRRNIQDEEITKKTISWNGNCLAP